jgi:hypothetical protein
MKRNQTVTVRPWNNEEVTIVGLNSCGDLKVEKSDASVANLQFDAFRFEKDQPNLIVSKK